MTERGRDERFMRRALELAARGLGRTWPNPMVGAVIVRSGRVLSEGWHRVYGGPHAEAAALRAAAGSVRGATVYCTLEPCSHFGKTPPCADALIGARVRRVVAAMRDPNPKVSGRGLARLRTAGIRVETGLLGDEARKLNEVFIKRVTTGLPFVIAKAAVSLDGKLACRTGISRWISGPAALRWAHRLRALSEAVIVGAGTMAQDDPALTVRLSRPLTPGRPLRVVLEGHRPIAAGARILRGAERQGVVIATTRFRHPLAGTPGLEIWTLPAAAGGGVDCEALLGRLSERGISLVLVEGGAEVHAAFMGLQTPPGRVLTDRVCWVVAPKILGGRDATGPVAGWGVAHPREGLPLLNWTCEPLGRDWLIQADLAGTRRHPRPGRR